MVGRRLVLATLIGVFLTSPIHIIGAFLRTQGWLEDGSRLRRPLINHDLSSSPWNKPPSLVHKGTNLGDDDSQSSKSTSSSSPSSTKLEIPILGPLLNRPKPLLIGESMWLDPPTPLQWKTIEACVDALEETLQRRQTQERNEQRPSKALYATIDQAPLVAVLHQGGKKYATLAAVVGIATTDDRHRRTDVASMDPSDASDFQESLNRLTLDLHSRLYSEARRVRLVGIGRAKLSKLTNRRDEVQHQSDNLKDGNDDDHSNNDENTLFSEPVLVAQEMQLVWDDSTTDGEYSKKSSPVHALNRLSMQASRIRFLHRDRQAIVRGLQAAQARLDVASLEWEDHDGIGSLFQFQDTVSSVTRAEAGPPPPLSPAAALLPPTNQQAKETLNKFVQQFDSAQAGLSLEATGSSHGASYCLELDNFGLGTTSSAMVELDSMAHVLTNVLRPYYSPERLETEDFFYEAFSWAALHSLQLYLTPAEIVDAIFHSTRTSERLDLVYHAQMRHKQDLIELARLKSKELRDCGEECTDLFD